jgi:amidophosphoribosyltransferase
MGGMFGVVSREDCVSDLFYGTDYHSHLGTVRGGLAVHSEHGFARAIKDITAAPFRSKMQQDVRAMQGPRGIGVISDDDDQPLIIGSHLGTYALVTVGRIGNLGELSSELSRSRRVHFAEVREGGVSPTELVAALINQCDSIEAGIRHAQAMIEGSCSLLALTRDGLYAARDRLGRTPLVLAAKEGARAVTMETCALPNLGYDAVRFLGPGEVVRVTADEAETMLPPGEEMQICTFLWVYYGYPASAYEGLNVEVVRNRCGAALARRDVNQVDLVAGIPDSGTGHAIGYANQAGIPYGRPFVKYTPTWPRSFMPQDQRVRELVAGMKLIPIPDLIRGRRVLFCEDSIVRGTQLRDTVGRIFDCGAKEVHMRPACPPLIHGCKFLNFSRSRSVFDLAARRAMHEMGAEEGELAQFADPDAPCHSEMVERTRQRLGLTTLRYQRLDDLVTAVGLPKEKLCTYCWDGAENCDRCPSRRQREAPVTLHAK